MRNYVAFPAATVFADGAADTSFIDDDQEQCYLLAKARYDQFIALGYTPDRLRIETAEFYFKLGRDQVRLLWYAGGRFLILKFLAGTSTGFLGDQQVSTLLAIDKSPRRKEKRKFKLVPIKN